MKAEIHGNPDFGNATVALSPGESIWAESGAMSYMSTDMQVSTRLVGGFFRALARKLVGGESLLVGEYTSPNGGVVAFSPDIPGMVLQRKLGEGELLNLTAGAFLACTPGMQLRTKFGGLKAFFSGEGAFFIQVTGPGDLFYNAYGGIIIKDVQGEYTVDTGHLVAWEPTLNYSIGGMGGLKSTFFSGEGLVMKFTGTGKLFLQSRYLGGIAGWLTPYCR